MTISALPSAPLITDAPDVFDAKASAHVASLSTLVTEMNAAIASVNMTKWISGTTYAIGDVTWSPVTFYAYRRKTAGAGTTDPSADATNWISIASAASGANADITSMTALTAPTAAANPVRATDLQVQLTTAFTTGGTATAFTLTPAPAITANAANQRFRVKFNAAAGTTPTLAVSGQAALNLKYKDSAGTKQAITATQVPINWISDVENDGTDWVVQSVAAQTKPAFSVHKNSTNQTGVVTITATLVTWSTEEFDTNANFASNRFTPTVAGIYQLNASAIWVTAVSGDTYDILIYKNGVAYKSVRKGSSSATPSSVSISAQVQANGTTDYFEIYIQQQSGANKDISGDTAYTYFNGCML